MCVHLRSNTTAHAPPAVLRRRGLRVWTIGPWVFVHTPRKHPLRSL